MANRHCTSWFVYCIALCVCLRMQGQVFAQRSPANKGVTIPRTPGPRSPKVTHSARASRVIIETSAPVTNLLQRADDAILREDWKLAIDSLQRVIDAPDGSLVPATKNKQDLPIIYQSASHYAAVRIAQLPQAGVSAYRLLYDGKAKRLYELALAAHQADGLWMIANRYTGTSYGDDALETLASWALDANRPEQALRLLHDLRVLVRVKDEDLERLSIMEAVAHAMIGAIHQAHQAMTPYRTDVTRMPLDQRWHHLVVHTVREQSTNRYILQGKPYESWPLSNGSLVGNGRLPGVSPEITSLAPWRYELNERNFRSSAGRDGASSRERLAYPFYRFAIADHRIILRTRQGCVALDAGDLTLLWRSPSLQRRLTQAVVTTVSTGRTGNQSRQIPENVAGDISVEGEYVYTVEPTVVGLLGAPQALPPPFAAQPRQTNRANFGVSSRLVTRKLETGELAWSRGGSGDPLDPLGDVRFRATPIMVDGQLWVPYERKRELFLGVLDPASGKDISHLFLCSGQSIGRRVTASLPLVHQSGVIYMASGYGTFFAIDTARRAVIWAHRIDVDQTAADAGRVFWETGMPVVARELVLAGSLADGALYAYNMLDGEIVWSQGVDHAAFIMAADDKHVWIAGQTFSCLETRTGHVVWSKELPFTQTGRAIVVGDRIIIPSIKSVMVLAAYTGEIIKTDVLTEKQQPLGDIVSYRSSLYSADPSYVRRFPDLSQMYPATKARLAQDDEDVRARLQLARLEILRGEPEAAISLLEPRDDRYTHAYRQMRARTLVDSWLSLANEGKGDPRQMARVLQQADKQATTNSQKVRVALAKSRWQHTGDDDVGAATTIWNTVASLPDDSQVELGGLAKGAAQLVLRRELYGVVAHMGLADKEGLTRHANKVLDELISAHAVSANNSDAYARSLRAIAEIGAPPETAQRARLEYAKLQLKQGRFELAIHDFVNCAAMQTSPMLSCTAMMYLIKIHRHLLHSPPSVTSRWVKALMAFSPDEQVPTAFEWFDVFGPSMPESSTLGAWLVQHSAIGGDFKPQANSHAAQSLVNNEDGSWTYMGASSTIDTRRLGHRRGQGNETGFSPTIVFLRDDQLAALHPSTGELLWKADLRFPEVFPHSSLILRNNRRGRNNTTSPKRTFVVDGQIIVVVSREGLSGIGLLTGKRLWVRPFDLLPRMSLPNKRDSAVASHGGMIATMHTGGRLSLLRAADGSTVWDRDMYGESVERIWLTETRVITADARMQRVHIVDRDDGRLIRQVLFTQPDDKGDLVTVAMIGNKLYGPTHSSRSDGLLGVDLITGQDVWQRDLDRPLVQLFDLNDHMLGVMLLGGGGYLVDVANSHKSISFYFEHVARVSGLHLIGDVLIAIYAERIKNRQVVSMNAYDLESGMQKWLRQDLAVVKGKTTTIKVMDDTIIAILEKVSGSRAQNLVYSVATINVESGVDGWREDLPRIGPKPYYRFNGDLEINAGSIVVGIASVIHGFTPVFPDNRVIETEMEP